MSLLTIVLTLAIVGLIVWAVTTFIPMPPKFQQLIYVITVVFLVLWILQGFGLINTGVRLK